MKCKHHPEAELEVVTTKVHIFSTIYFQLTKNTL